MLFFTVLSSFVTRSPLNEDVFAAPTKEDIPVTHEEIKDLQAKIYKLFLQVIISPFINRKDQMFAGQSAINAKMSVPVSVSYQYEINPLGKK